VTLHEKGLFTWAEWAETLSAEIRAAQAAGDPDTGETYYVHWLRALERLMIARGVTTAPAIDDTTAAWHRAAEATPARPADRAPGPLPEQPIRDGAFSRGQRHGGLGHRR
jgi:nitrile hydratase accessory protein